MKNQNLSKVLGNLMEKLLNKKELESVDDLFTESAFFNRHIFLGDITPEVGQTVESMIRVYNQYDSENDIEIEDRKPIWIFIDSNGGDLDAAFMMYDAIEISVTPVYTVNIGCAFSGGFLTYIAGHKRYSYKHSKFLIHEGSATMGGDAGKFQNFATFYKKQLSEMKNLILKRTKITEEQYEDNKREDWWLFADEGLELGFVDEILTHFVY